jgi:5-methylcytosine-specific restriction endonuclease McrA
VSGTTYFTGRPCRRGHIAPRYVSCRQCVKCLEFWAHAKPEQKAVNAKNWEKKNPEKVRAKYRRFHKKHKARLSNEARKYRSRPEYVVAQKERQRRNYQKRKQDQNFRADNVARAAAWNAANPVRRRVHSHRRRARLKQAEGFHTASDISRIYDEQGGRCVYCRVILGRRWHLDHIIAISVGGTNWPSNLQITCVSCNVRKSNKNAAEFAREMGVS